MAIHEDDIRKIQEKYSAIKDCLSEKGRRIWAAVEASAYGYGGPTLVCKALSMSTATVYKGIRELKKPDISKGRIRSKGGGRKAYKETQPGILEALNNLVDPTAKGNPENPLKWTSKSVRNLAEAMKAQGYNIGKSTIGFMLHELGYSLQANKKTIENSNHIDRDAQFEHINNSVLAAQKQSNPAVSVDAKKKENIGNYKNHGREYSEKSKPIEVKGHDFIDKTLGKIVPYGVYDIGLNKGWVSVGISSDTAQFAVNTIRSWWYMDGRKRYPVANEILITADCGGSNGYRTRLWKVELQKLADEIQMSLKVCHFPPGTSKWNKIEHRLFSYISKNWRGKPLITREVVLNLIGNTKTKSGLSVAAVLDENDYKTGIKISDEEMANINLIGDAFHPEWNYTIKPNPQAL